MQYPSFSIVIPTYQRRDTVCEAVRSVANVEYQGAVEIIVVVDGSTDGTEAALEAISCPFPKKIVRQENRGAAAARNRGAAEATGDIILFIDDDMLCSADVVRQHAESYRAGADAVVGDFPLDAASPKGFISEWIRQQAHWDRGEVLTPFDIFTGHLSVSRVAFHSLGGFDESFTSNGSYGNEDIDFGARLLQRNCVRYNRQAIVRQRSSVGPAEYMRRSRSLAKSDVRFSTKHPALARELFENRGGRTSRRLQLLSRTPFVPEILAACAVGAALVALKSRFRSNRVIARLFFGAWLVNYWSAIGTELNSMPRRDN